MDGLEGIKIISAKEMARLEQEAILEGISPEKFMTQAAENLAQAIDELVCELGAPKNITVIAGKGNNGGDGLATALCLLARGFSVKAFCLYPIEKCSPLNRKFFRLLSAKIPVEPWDDSSCFLEKGCVLDAICGTGFQQEPDAIMNSAIEKINASSLLVVSIDIPSGLDGNLGVTQPHIVKAHTTFFLEMAKTGFFIQGGFAFVGQLKKIAFGLPQKFHDRALAFGYLLQEDHLKQTLPVMDRLQHKYSRGYVVGVAGSQGMSGAALLASLGAMRSGAGIVRLFHRCAAQEIAAQKFLEVITSSLDLEHPEEFFEQEHRARALFFGPGLGQEISCLQHVLDLLQRCSKPCVVDADLLEPYAQDTRKFSSEIIMTPHRKEMLRCLGKLEISNDEDFFEDIQGFVEEKKVVVVLKGAPTLIFAPKKPLLVMVHGDKGMATAGSGDILSGMIAGLLSRGMRTREAAALAVYIHGRAGEIAASKKTSQSMIATDILEHIPDVFAAEFA